MRERRPIRPRPASAGGERRPGARPPLGVPADGAAPRLGEPAPVETPPALAGPRAGPLAGPSAGPTRAVDTVRPPDRLLRLAQQLVVPPLAVELDDPALARAQEQFWDYFLRDARARQSAVERARTDEQAAAFAAHVLARLAEPRLAVQRVEGRQPERVPDVRGPVAEVLQAATQRRAAPRLDLGVAAGAGRELWDEECDSWVDLPDGVPAGRYLALSVTGESMAPLLHPEDVVLVRLSPLVARETVIVARHPEDGYVVKRVARVTDAHIELRSLNPAFAPITIPRDDRLVLGTVVLRWCAHHDDGGAGRAAGTAASG